MVHVYVDLYDLYTTTIGWYDIGTDYLCGIEIVADIENASVESIVFAEDPIYCKIGEQKKPNVAIYPLNASNKRAYNGFQAMSQCFMLTCIQAI